MKTFLLKILFCILVIPVYPLKLFSEWDEKTSYYGAKFNFKKFNREFWDDFIKSMKAKPNIKKEE